MLEVDRDSVEDSEASRVVGFVYGKHSPFVVTFSGQSGRSYLECGGERHSTPSKREGGGKCARGDRRAADGNFPPMAHPGPARQNDGGRGGCPSWRGRWRSASDRLRSTDRARPWVQGSSRSRGVLSPDPRVL